MGRNVVSISKRFRWVALGLVLGLAVGGVAYAVVVNQPNPSDRYFACVSPAGVVRSGSIRRNTPPPKCPSASDTVESWNAVGTTGPSGATGVAGGPGPTGATGTAPAGDGYGTLVGVYTVTTTNSGCGEVEMRAKVVTISGKEPVDPYGPCSGFYCQGLGHVLAVGESCPNGSSPNFVQMHSQSCVDLRARLGFSNGYFEDRPTIAHSGYDDEFTPDVNEITPSLMVLQSGPTVTFNLSLAGQGVGFVADADAPVAHRSIQACATTRVEIRSVAMPSLVDVGDAPWGGLNTWAVYSVS